MPKVVLEHFYIVFFGTGTKESDSTSVSLYSPRVRGKW